MHPLRPLKFLEKRGSGWRSFFAIFFSKNLEHLRCGDLNQLQKSFFTLPKLKWRLCYENLAENEDCYISEQYDLPKNWEKWEKISSRFPMKRYLLFKSHTSEDENVSFVYFVDVLKTAALMQDHYDLFRKAVGFDLPSKSRS